MINRNEKYQNQTQRRTREALKIAFQVETYGPGFQSEEVLEKGVEHFVNARDSFDLLVVDLPTALQSAGKIRNNDAARRSVAEGMTFRYYDAHAKSSDAAVYASGLNQLAIPKIVSCMNLDMYAVDEEIASFLNDFDGLFLSMGAQFSPRKEDCPRRREESFGDRFSQTYHDCVNRNLKRHIPWTHVLGSSELSGKSAASGNYVAAPGVGYASRRAAAASLQSAGVKFRHASLGMRAIDKAWFSNKLMRRSSMIDLSNSLHQRFLKSSRVAYVDGSFVRAVVRKYFEAPAAGSAMVAVPPVNAECLGLKDGYNYVAAEPETAGPVVKQLLKDEERRRRIAARGREWAQGFTVSAFAKRLESISDDLVNDSYVGRKWHNGEWAPL